MRLPAHSTQTVAGWQRRARSDFERPVSPRNHWVAAERSLPSRVWPSANISRAMARNTSFGRDPGLQFRMLLTLFLLGLVYAILIGVLFAAGVGAVTIAVIAGALFLIQYFTSDKVALLSMNARIVGPEDGPEARRLHTAIDRLCIQANLPKPRVA